LDFGFWILDSIKKIQNQKSKIQNQKEKAADFSAAFSNFIPAASYFPEPLPAQYHRRCGA
jgi:hypothetical protein